MRKTALIHVVGTQAYADGHEDKTDFLTVATFYRHKENYYIVYQESEVTGMAGVSTSIKIEQDKVILNRMGSVELRQIYEKGVLHHSTYVTPFGSFYLSAFTEELEIGLTEQGGHITLKYNLFADQERVSQNSLRITIKEDAPR